MGYNSNVAQNQDQSQEVINISWDPGFGGDKAGWAKKDGTVEIVHFPSVAGFGTIPKNVGLNLAGMESSQRMELPFQVLWNGIQWLIGHNVSEFARVIERMDNNRFLDGAELLAMLYVVLSQFNLSGRKVSIVVGLPTELVKDKRQAAIYQKGMSKWMLGHHSFQVDGITCEVEIVKIKTIAQPFGAWFDWGLRCNEKNKWVWDGSKDQKAPAFIIDGGFNTLDAAGIINGTPSPIYTDGKRLGMKRVAEMIARAVNEKYGVPLTLHHADKLMRLHIVNKPALIYVNGEKVNITSIVKQCINTVASDAIGFIDGIIGMEFGMFNIILSGGGMVALNGRFSDRYPDANMAPAPAFANARGLAKLAASGWLER